MKIKMEDFLRTEQNTKQSMSSNWEKLLCEYSNAKVIIIYPYPVSVIFSTKNLYYNKRVFTEKFYEHPQLTLDSTKTKTCN